MARAFITTNKDHYRWNLQKPTQPINPDKSNFADYNGDLWLLDDKKLDEANLEIAKTTVHDLYLKRMRTNYQISFGRKTGSADKEEVAQDLENQLLLSCTELYARRAKKVLPPLAGSRRIHGYIKASLMHTPLTVYQNVFGRVACDILKSADRKQ
ncbi:uncharacterized protein LOC132705426 [Cylas formicarius]|uniref:uncharacterized protein LOC132705426 n=1 Tax=Cylas formicarius TaxID=197179 RepID=UPI0029589A13|nr:uncharacterized protein LOC132705426 [Cylas formicarius]